MLKSASCGIRLLCQQQQVLQGGLQALQRSALLGDALTLTNAPAVGQHARWYTPVSHSVVPHTLYCSNLDRPFTRENGECPCDAEDDVMMVPDTFCNGRFLHPVSAARIACRIQPGPSRCDAHQHHRCTSRLEKGDMAPVLCA